MKDLFTQNNFHVLVSAIGHGVIPSDAWLQSDSDDTHVRVALLLHVDVWGETELLWSEAVRPREIFSKLITYDEGGLVKEIHAMLQEAADNLYACNKHEDCRTCKDLGKACLAQRLGGVRYVGARCQ